MDGSVLRMAIPEGAALVRANVLKSGVLLVARHVAAVPRGN